MVSPTEEAAAGPPTAGSRVRVANLQSAQELNGAIGVVIGAADEATGRLPVVLLGAAGRARPQGIKIQPANLDLLPAQRCVKLLGLQTQQMQRNAEQQLELASCRAGRLAWKECPVPSLLGVPLALKRLAPHLPRPNFEQPAVLLLMDPLTGFAPMDVQFSGEDWSVDELWGLHDYNCHLLNKYERWCEEDVGCPEVAEERAEALCPQAFANFLRSRNDDAEEDDDVDPEDY